MNSQEEIKASIFGEHAVPVTEDSETAKPFCEAIGLLSVENAGLALLSLWIPRLFGMLDLLNAEKTDFKDVESRIRGIFIIQHLATAEDREYNEQELSFNRILVNCPFSCSLPRRLVLKSNELQVTELMLESVKSSWPKMCSTSMPGFQSRFIQRSGNLQQQDEGWLLTVIHCPYDVLLDSIPWSFGTIRFPWLKKHIRVEWR